MKSLSVFIVQGLLWLYMLGFGMADHLQAQNFGGGAAASLTVSQIAGDLASGYQKAGVSGGFYVFHAAGKQGRIQMELNFIQKGAGRKADPDDLSVFSYSRRLNYIELPLIYAYTIDPLIVMMGVSADFYAGGREKIDGYRNDNFSADDWKKMTLNSIVGIKYRLGEKLWLQIRSTNSINSIRKAPVPGNVRRYSRNKFGEFNDVLSFGFARSF